LQNLIKKFRVKRRYLVALSVLVVLLLTAPPILKSFVARVQRKINPVQKRAPCTVSSAAAHLHSSLTIADLHSDALLWGLDLTRENKTGHVDIPRLIKGNVTLQVFSVVTKVPRLGMDGFDRNSDQISILAKVDLWPWRTWSFLLERALYQARLLRKFEQRSKGKLVIVTSHERLESFLAQRKKNSNLVAGVLSLEGGHALESRLENIDLLYSAGFRIIGLNHYFNNELGGASLDAGDDGLTGFGREVVKQLNQKGMIIDLAHSSPRLLDDVLDITTGPVIVTHTGVDGVCPGQRNLADKHIRRIVEHGGLIGIGYDPFFHCDLGVKAIVNSIRYVADRYSVEHVALGSDFDGTIFAPFDTAGLELLTDELIQSGFSPGEIYMVMGGNVINFLLNSLP
jgi:membrane dipeptidase